VYIIHLDITFTRLDLKLYLYKKINFLSKTEKPIWFKLKIGPLILCCSIGNRTLSQLLVAALLDIYYLSTNYFLLLKLDLWCLILVFFFRTQEIVYTHGHNMVYNIFLCPQESRPTTQLFILLHIILKSCHLIDIYLMGYSMNFFYYLLLF